MVDVGRDDGARSAIFSYFGRIRQNEFDRGTPVGRLPGCPRPSIPNVTKGFARYSKPGERRLALLKRRSQPDLGSRRHTSQSMSLATVGWMCWNFWTLRQRSDSIHTLSSEPCTGDKADCVGPMSASLIGHLESSAFRLSTAAVSMSLAGSCFSSELGTKALPSWDSRTRWNNLYRGLAI